jgi:hypothetical protein
MSELEQSFMEQFAEDGTFDFVKAEIARVNATTSPDEPSDTDSPSETAAEVQEPVVDSTEEEVPAVVGIEPEVEPEEPAPVEPEPEVEEYLELSPEVEKLVNEKYGGDLGKALAALGESQSLIGRQGNELGDLRAELQQIRETLERPAPQPYAQWPDEYDEPEVAVPRFRQIAEAAFGNEDPQTFINAVEAWNQVDPLGAATFKDAKRVELLLRDQEQTPAPAATQEAPLETQMAALVSEYPEIQKPEIHAEIGALAQARPTLGRMLAEATTTERVQILKDLYLEVAGRKASETSQQALRRVAIRRSEDATQARREAQVAKGGGGAPQPVVDDDVRIPLGKTQQSLSTNKLQRELSAIFGHEIEIGE